MPAWIVVPGLSIRNLKGNQHATQHAAKAAVVGPLARFPDLDRRLRAFADQCERDTASAFVVCLVVCMAIHIYICIYMYHVSIYIYLIRYI